MKTIKVKFTPETAMHKVSQVLKASMRRIISMAGLGLILSGTTLFEARAAVPAMTKLTGHVPPIVSKLRASGTLSTGTNLNLAIGLPLRNREELTNLLQQIYDPSSTNYHRYLTPEEFTARFGPTEQDYAVVENFAKINGLKVTGTHPNRMLLDVAAKASDIEKAFKVTLRTYRHPKENRDFYAPDSEPQVAAALPILHVSGLDNYSLPHPQSTIRPLNQPSGATPMRGSGPAGTYQGADFRNAYVPGTTLNGTGQNVGLLQFDGFYPSDITAYAQQIGLTNVPNLVVVPVDGGVPIPTPFGNPEVSLDIEMVLSISPGVSTIYVYEAPNPSPWVDILNRMANDNLAKQLSASWAGGEQPNPAAEQIFQQMALQGQTFFNASGDSDAYNAAAGLSIPFPCDSPHITLVGGTTLTTGANAVYTSETVWNWGVEYGLDGIGSSGGVSAIYSIPNWQTNINFTSSHGSTIMRNVPDVALTADNVYVIYGSGQNGAFGGTSCAAPLWAGFTALVNQQGAINGHAPAGFLNPAIYAIASGANYTTCFHDTTTGNNEWSGSPNLFSAVAGYDLCTGLGTPNGTNLINALTSAGVSNTITHLSPPPPPYGSTLSALNGGNPNGTWQLYVQDDTIFNTGIISNGWIISLTTANPVGASGDLALGMTASAGAVIVGDNLSFTLTVTNYGPSISSNILVSDSLPLGAILFPSTPDQGTVSRNGQLLNWNVGTLGVSAGSRWVFTIQPTTLGSLPNYATASADTPDANPADDFVSTNILVSVQTPPQLSASFVSGNHQFQFSVTDLSLQAYVVQASTNLVNWVPIYTNPAPASTITTFSDSSTSNYLYRFYRVLLQ